jgi:hypothetical protein
MVAGGSSGRGSVSFLGLALEAVAEAPGLAAGVADVRAVGEAIDDGFREPGVGEYLGPLNCSCHTFVVVC